MNRNEIEQAAKQMHGKDGHTRSMTCEHCLAEFAIEQVNAALLEAASECRAIGKERGLDASGFIEAINGLRIK